MLLEDLPPRPPLVRSESLRPPEKWLPTLPGMVEVIVRAAGPPGRLRLDSESHRNLRAFSMAPGMERRKDRKRQIHGNYVAAVVEEEEVRDILMKERQAFRLNS